MKFGERLKEECLVEWKSSYLDYDALKAVIRLASAEDVTKEHVENFINKNNLQENLMLQNMWNDIQRLRDAVLDSAVEVQDANSSSAVPASTSSTSANGPSTLKPSIPKVFSAYFSFLLDNELQKVTAFCDHQRTMIQSKLRQIASTWRKDHAYDVARNRHLIANHIANLSSYVELNYTGFYKIVKKWDKRMKDNLLEPFMQKVNQSQFLFAGSVCMQIFREVESLANRSQNSTRTSQLQQIDSSRKNQTEKTIPSTLGSSVISALRSANKAFAVLNNDVSEEEKLHQLNDLVNCASPLVANAFSDVDILQSTNRVLHTKIEIFQSLLHLFVKNTSHIDPDIARSVQKLAKAHKDLFQMIVDSNKDDKKINSESADQIESDSGSESGSDKENILKIVKDNFKSKLVSKKSRKRMSGRNGLPFKQGSSLSDEGRNQLEDSTTSTDDNWRCSGVAGERCAPCENIVKEALQSVYDGCENFIQNTAIGWLPKYDFHTCFVKDVSSGIAVGIVGVTQGIAYSSLLGISAEYGCYSVIFPALFYSLLGSSKYIAVGPMSIPCVLSSILADSVLVDHPEIPKAAIIMAIAALIGIIFFVMGFLRIGALTTSLISRPVLKGFATASAIIVILGQLKYVLGISYPKGTTIIEILPNIASHLQDTKVVVAVYSLCALGLLLFVKYQRQKVMKKHESEDTEHKECDDGDKDDMDTELHTNELSLEIEQSNTDVKSTEIEGQRNRKVWWSFFKAFAFIFTNPTTLLLIVAVFFGFSLCGWTDTPSITLQTIYSSGASLPYSAYLQALQLFTCLTGTTNIIYEPTGSGSGLKAILDNSKDFVGSDVTLQESIYYERQDIENVLQVPSMTSAVCAFANIPNISSVSGIPMIMDGTTLGQIFTGQIQFWDDPAIVRQNLNLIARIPHKPIQRIVRADASGTTYIFSKALSALSDDFKNAVKIGTTIKWPRESSVSPVNYTQGVISHVESRSFSIGYANVGDIMSHPDLSCLELKGEGSVVSPSVAGIEASVNLAGENLDIISRVQTNCFNSNKTILPQEQQELCKEAWPITTYSYFMMQKHKLPTFRSSCDERLTVLDFFRWYYNSSVINNILVGNKFFPLPQAKRLEIIAELNNMTCANEKRSVINDETCVAKKDGGKMCSNVKLVGEIAPRFSPPVIPNVPLSVYTKLFLQSFFISILVAVEHLANAQTYAFANGEICDDTHELLSLGVVNAFSACFSCCVTGGGFSRSAVNSKAGATSSVSLLISSFVAALLTFSMTTVIAHIPKFVIGVIIVNAISGLVYWREALMLWNFSRSDFAVFIFSAIFTLTIGILNGLIASVITSVAIFLYVATKPTSSVLGRVQHTTQYEPIGAQALTLATTKNKRAVGKIRKPVGISIFRFEAPLFFANFTEFSHQIESLVSNHKTKDGKELLWDSIIIDFSSIPWMDATAAFRLRQIIETISQKKDSEISIYAVCCNNLIYNMIEDLKIFKKSSILPSVHSAVTFIHNRRQQAYNKK